MNYGMLGAVDYGIVLLHLGATLLHARVNKLLAVTLLILMHFIDNLLICLIVLVLIIKCLDLLVCHLFT